MAKLGSPQETLPQALQLHNYDKGIPGASLSLDEIGAQGWNILRQDLSFPVALLRDAHLDNNLQWMQRFISEQNVQLFPHGKTTMAPALFQAQMAHGCSGLTAATVHHLAVYLASGVSRVIMANQILGKANLQSLFTLLSDYPETELYQIIDSAEGFRALQEAADSCGFNGRIALLLEMGAKGGRTGLRTLAHAEALAQDIHASGDSRFPLVGVEAFEGLFYQDNLFQRVGAHLEQTVALFNRLVTLNLLQGEQQILSAGGSAYFDRVVHAFAQAKPCAELQVFLRSGCYISHDHGMYERAFADMEARDLVRFSDQLLPALEVWSVVQSKPEAQLAFAALGKRDISYDVEMPLARYNFRPGRDSAPRALNGEVTVSGLNDQHAYLQLAPGSDIQVGDLLGFGVSHPCTTFDKWRYLFRVNEQYDVSGAVATYF